MAALGQLGRYRVVRPIASGGMGQVYLGALEGPEGFRRDVAIKVIHALQQTDPRLRERFLCEARTLAGLRHRAIVPILDLGDEADQLYLVMELLEGLDLRELCQRHHGILPWAAVAFIGAEVARGLAAVHSLVSHGEQGLVHGDISPSNLMACRDGAVKIVDFGLVRSSGEERSVSGIEGKLSYMPPEAVAGLPHDRGFDIYALGVVLYELATGVNPFAGSNDAEIVHRICHHTPAPPSSIVSSIPASLDRAIGRALARDRGQRWGTASELAEALASICSGRCSSDDIVALVESAENPIGVDRPRRTLSTPAATRITPVRKRAIWLGGAVLAISLALIAVAAGRSVPTATIPPAHSIALDDEDISFTLSATSHEQRVQPAATLPGRRRTAPTDAAPIQARPAGYSSPEVHVHMPVRF